MKFAIKFSDIILYKQRGVLFYEHIKYSPLNVTIILLNFGLNVVNNG